MATEDAKGNLHDERGRFTAKGGGSTPYINLLKSQGYDTAGMSEEWAENFAKDVGANKTVKIPLSFFAEKAIENQTPREIKKGIRNLKKRISEHYKKISSPEKYYANWNQMSEREQLGRIKHWEDEILRFEQSINNRNERLKEIGKNE